METTLAAAEGLSGRITVPGDKSVSHRAVMLGALADGETCIKGFLAGEDCLSTISCFEALGISISRNENSVIVQGKGLSGLQKPEKTLDAGNSGTTMRLMSGILAGQSFSCRIDGDASLRTRPMDRVIAPLALMGAQFASNKAPLEITGTRLHGIRYSLPVPSAQVKSAILLASLFADGETVIEEPIPSRDHTELMLRACGAGIERRGNHIYCHSAKRLNPFVAKVPGDISSAAFFIAAALITPGSSIQIENVGVNPTRTGILEAFRAMGADIDVINLRSEAGEPVGDILAKHSKLVGTEISGNIIPRMIDEVPVFAVAALAAKGKTVIKDAQELKVKEVNRIDALAKQLSKLGAHVEERPDGLIIEGGHPLTGAVVESGGDHRMAMSLAIASLIAKGETVIKDSGCVDISFPGFFDCLERVKRHAL
ncbi:MAG: 3-phosphoshikimate 1-carboxyvinyltransferase [Clostridiales bacterium]|jgi:3-phosphoshikimate 1-carboxyvinyltransferase|nr:3-phosphoshikimate 1-carboxyvinyltransferase [Clostridiales bacterium]MDR2750630.1 3-phosphoshikimate 1-carboxyvinyltransferase [Clostridiales bacterium]